MPPIRQERGHHASRLKPRKRDSLDSAHQQQHDDDDQDKSQAPSRSVTPAAAMRPTGQGAYEKQDKNDEKDGAQHIISPETIDCG